MGSGYTCFDKATALWDILYEKRIRNTLNYLATISMPKDLKDITAICNIYIIIQ